MAEENGNIVETVLLPEDLWQKTKFKAVVDRISFSEVVQRALGNYLGAGLHTSPARKRRSRKAEDVQMVLPYGNREGKVFRL